MKAMNSKRGFTLIELLIVIAIIGVLAVAFLPSLLGAPAKGRDTARIADLQKIQKVLINGNLAGKDYPDTNCVAANDSFNDYLTDFGGKFPVDPATSAHVVTPQGIVPAAGCDKQYAYVKGPTGYAFGLYAKMETPAAANTTCAGITANSAVLTPLAAAPVAAAGYCYAILTQ